MVTVETAYTGALGAGRKYRQHLIHGPKNDKSSKVSCFSKAITMSPSFCSIPLDTAKEQCCKHPYIHLFIIKPALSDFIAGLIDGTGEAPPSTVAAAIQYR